MFSKIVLASAIAGAPVAKNNNAREPAFVLQHGTWLPTRSRMGTV
jgi:hypothetical protein